MLNRETSEVGQEIIELQIEYLYHGPYHKFR